MRRIETPHARLAAGASGAGFARPGGDHRRGPLPPRARRQESRQPAARTRRAAAAGARRARRTAPATSCSSSVLPAGSTRCRAPRGRRRPPLRSGPRRRKSRRSPGPGRRRSRRSPGRRGIPARAVLPRRRRLRQATKRARGSGPLPACVQARARSPARRRAGSRRRSARSRAACGPRARSSSGCRAPRARRAWSR